MPTTPAATGEPARFVELDALRAVAASWVLLFHYLTRFDQKYAAYGYTLIGNFHVPDGVFGVNLFFMISGFVIFMTLRSGAGAVDFVVSRFSRLYPAYWAAMLLSTIVALFLPLPGQSLSLGQVLVNATMMQAYLGMRDIDGAYWSLAYELGFYACMLALLACGLLRRIEAVCWFWLAGEVAAHVAARLGWRLDDHVSLLLAFPYAQFFTAGIVFYLASVEGYTRGRVGLLAACLAVCPIVLPGHAATGFAVVFFVTFHLAISGRLRRYAVRPLVWLGTISYPLYLLHQDLGYRAIQAMLERGLPPLVIVPVTAAGAIALAAAVSAAVERPGTRAIRRGYRRLVAGGKPSLWATSLMRLRRRT